MVLLYRAAGSSYIATVTQSDYAAEQRLPRKKMGLESKDVNF
jgi:hypothetical protein